MVADLAEAISLVSYGNAYLSGLLADAPDFLAENSSFQYMAAVEFRRLVRTAAPWYSRIRGKYENVTASDLVQSPPEWLRDLKARNCKKLYLQRGRQKHGPLEAHVAVAFAGFSDWWIYVEGERDQEQWGGRLGKAEHPNGRRIWINRYFGGEAKRIQVTYNLNASSTHLQSALEDTLEVAEKIKYFDDWFRYALSQLGSIKPTPKFHPDMLPTVGYSLLARQVAFAASSAWVFGGMGSWNDVIVDPAFKERYDTVTRQLYDSVLQALIDSVNSFDSRKSD
jgi:hypothetical protein